MLLRTVKTTVKVRNGYIRSSIRKCNISTIKGLDIISPTIGLNETRSEYYHMARTFADSELRPFASKWDRECIFPVDTFKKFGEIGFGGWLVREDVGGTNLKRADTMPIIEALATGCTSTTALLTIHNANCLVIDKYGTQEQRQKWLPKLLTMDLLISFCLTEPGSGSDAASLITKAEYDSRTDEYVINGTKVFISGAGQSDLYVVMCRTGQSITSIVVEKGTPGLSFGAKEQKMGWNSQPTRQVNFEDVRVPASNRLSKEGEGFKIAMSALDGARLSVGACSVGAAHACFEIALNYTKERKQFKKSIADFQATQFKLADMAGKIVSARLMLRQAAELMDQGHPAASAQCAIAKKIATDQGFEVCNDALQMLGGYGYLKDYDIERYVRDCRVHQILEGTNEIMRHIVGKALVSK